MKTKFTILVSALLFAFQVITIKAQTILFQEDFETSPVTSMKHVLFGQASVQNAPLPTASCGKACRGKAADFNSAKVDFKAAQNSSSFLGYNAQASWCGGFSDAQLSAGPLNFVGVGALKFKCRYFKSTTLGWGPTKLKVTFSSGPSANFVIETVFTTTDKWDTLEIALPSSMISNSVTITFDIGGGEGVGLDDIKVVGTAVTGIHENNSGMNVSLFPNPVSTDATFTFDRQLGNALLRITDLSGKELKSINFSGQQVTVGRGNLSGGIYFYQIISEATTISSGKLLVE